MERNKTKEEELKILAKECKKNPELFKRETFVDSPEFLETIGISFKNNQNFPQGYLKLWPQDFIVEEILKDETIKTADSAVFFDEKNKFSEEDPTIYATLVKCKLSTFEAVQELSSFLSINAKKIQFAGIKDKDAITSQLISFRGADIQKLKEISSPYFFLKDIYSGKGTVEVGSLKGNKFTVLIRADDSFDKKQFLSDLEDTKEKGFFNFFYSQRFGSPRFVNWFWGLLILKGEYRNTVLSFLCSEGQREIQYFKNLREEIKKNIDNWEKIEEIIAPFPLVLQNELRIVRYLKNNPRDYIGALNQIPEQIQLWVFAYASLLFNRKISEYLHDGKPLPEKLPLILSKDKNDWLPYYEFLAEDKISSMPLANLKPFSDIQWRKREIKTREQVKIHKIEIIPEGIVLSFSLPKGCYATTFLAHFFQLTTGLPPKNISDKIVDIKEILSEGSLKELIEKFKEITFSKTEDLFEKFE
jgi:tRNA pseudouridine13 synthase